MNRFAYHRAKDVDDALRLLRADPKAKVLAGGTNLVDLMKYDVESPSAVIDIGRLPLRAIEARDDGALRIGALVSNADTAYHPEVRKHCPLLANAILAGASGQLRNMATTGGNLLQRTRCHYFYDPQVPCNKRAPGSGCGAIDGVNRNHAILGTSESCIATHPSDMCVALAALEATVVVQSEAGERKIPFAEFHRLPGDDPSRDTTLNSDELILGVDVPSSHFGNRYTYLKVRERHSYAFALVSVAAALELDASNTIVKARVAVGGVAHKPWRVPEAEALLEGKKPDREAFGELADRLLLGAKGRGENDFKIPLAHRAVIRALAQAAAGVPQPIAEKRFL